MIRQISLASTCSYRYRTVKAWNFSDYTRKVFLHGTTWWAGNWCSRKRKKKKVIDSHRVCVLASFLITSSLSMLSLSPIHLFYRLRVITSDLWEKKRLYRLTGAYFIEKKTYILRIKGTDYVPVWLIHCYQRSLSQQSSTTDLGTW